MEIFTADSQPDIPVLKTGLPALDAIIGGGLPTGKVAEVYGLPSTGKTTLCMQMVTNFQKQGLTVLWIDLENAWDRGYAKDVGVDLKKLLMMKPDYGEDAFEGIEKMLREKKAQVVVIDSIPALAPRAELEAEVGKPTMGAQARLIAQAMRKLIPLLEKTGAVLIFINQLRVNLMGGQYDPYTRPGGMSLKFYERTAIQLRRKMGLKRGNEIIGYEIEAKAIKSYSTSPLKTAMFQLIFGRGFIKEFHILEVAIEKNIIFKKGNTFWYKNIKLGVGKNQTLDYIEKNEKILKNIKDDIDVS